MSRSTNVAWHGVIRTVRRGNGSKNECWTKITICIWIYLNTFAEWLNRCPPLVWICEKKFSIQSWLMRPVIAKVRGPTNDEIGIHRQHSINVLKKPFKTMWSPATDHPPFSAQLLELHHAVKLVLVVCGQWSSHLSTEASHVECVKHITHLLQRFCSHPSLGPKCAQWCQYVHPHVDGLRVYLRSKIYLQQTTT